MSDYQYLTDTGVIVPDTADLLAEVQGEWQGSFGADLNVDPSTPQGVMIGAETNARAAVAANNAALANQINPNIAGGVFLAAIMALTGIEPPAGTVSTIAAPGVTLAGIAGATIPPGQQVRLANGTLWQTTTAVTLDGVTGMGTTGAQCTTVGPNACNIGDMSGGGGGTLVNPALGLETINNTVAATLGQNALNDAQLRTLRNNTLALQGQSLAEAIIGGLSDPTTTPGVQSLKFRENKASAPAVIDGINLVANSVWACVNGGSDDDVAATLLEFTSGGCAFNGAVNVNVVEPASGQTYVVQFDRPTVVPIYVKINVRAPGVAAPTQAVQQAIVDYANGNISGFQGFIVGENVSPFELSGAVMSEVPGAFVHDCQVSLMSGSGYTRQELVMALNQIAFTQAANIDVTIVS